MLANQVVADVQLLQALCEGGDDLRVAVAKIEDPAVAVAVDKLLLASGIPDVGAFTPPEHEVDPHGGEE